MVTYNTATRKYEVYRNGKIIASVTNYLLALALLSH